MSLTYHVYDTDDMTPAEIYGHVLAQLGEERPEIVALTADLAKDVYKRQTLTFNNARELNKVFQGKSKKNPRPNAAAILHLSKLSKIDKVLGRLEHYLQPDEEMLKDPDFFAFCVKLSIFVMTFGIREIEMCIRDRIVNPLKFIMIPP